MDKGQFGHLTIVAFDARKYTHITLPRVLLAFLFGNDNPEKFHEWAKEQIEEDAQAFAKFCKDWEHED